MNESLSSCSGENEVENVGRLGVLERLAAENLAGHPANEASEALPSSSAAVLRLEELVADDAGAIVIDVGPGVRTLVLEGTVEVVDRGVVTPETIESAAGSDVRSYVTLGSGTTVVFPSDVELLIQMPPS
ncbi:MAG: hypothetical protein KatS3mg117_0591 [Geminicoccaceae bacterium]|nr:MAG: hypothetical protein KatS3mg117_0591 [Geminicoccaceae bacterium]